MSNTTSTFWCYRCNHFIRLIPPSLNCPDCQSGFIESIDNPTRPRFPSSSSMYRTRIRNPSDRSPFNPVIVLRGGNPSNTGPTFDLYYDDGSGSGLRPLPSSMSEFLLGSGFERLLDQLSQIEVGRISNNNVNSNGGNCNPPASKAAIESLPDVEIGNEHLESCCVVCREEYILGGSVSEMPCKHLFHKDCILPWLMLRNSCPVCRHELPVDNDNESGASINDEANGNMNVNEDETVGLTIWRLPGGGFAVGRFAGGRRNGERELPVVYTEMDGGFSNGNGGVGVGRRIGWGTRGGRVMRERNGNGLKRVLSSLFACFGVRGGSGSLDTNRSRGWGFEVNDHDASEGRW